MAQKPTCKWQLSAWPPGPRSCKDDKGHNRSTVLWSRDYDNPASANRAAPGIHKRFPDAQIEITVFEYKGWFWVAGSGATTKLYWCFTCDGRVNWCMDQWHCPRCGNEWHDEQVREEPAGRTDLACTECGTPAGQPCAITCTADQALDPYAEPEASACGINACPNKALPDGNFCADCQAAIYGTLTELIKEMR